MNRTYYIYIERSQTDSFTAMNRLITFLQSVALDIKFNPIASVVIE